MGLLTLTMVVLSIYQVWFLYNAPDVAGYGSIPANANGWPDGDQRGVFVVLNDNHNPVYSGNLLQLLATTEPGVIDETQGAHLRSAEIKSLLVQAAALNEPADYRVYRIGDPEMEAMKYERQPGGKVLLITPESGNWTPGAYSVDTPADGMFGGRTYFQFYVDPEK